MQGKAPRDIAPSLYKLAWRKHLTVKEQIENQSWTRGLWRMNSIEEMADFIVLWDLVQGVHLTMEEDQITWKWTADGIYTAKSAYQAQFKGIYCTFKPGVLWRAHAVGKHKFFSWLLVQEKLLTADKLQARNWPCNPVCRLCSLHFETAEHLCLHCPFAIQVWELVRTWSGDTIRVPTQGATIEEWWCDALMQPTKNERRQAAAYLMYTAWNLWKERNRRVFEGKAAEPKIVRQLIKEEMQLRYRACGAPDIS